MKRWVGFGVITLLVVACKAPQPRLETQSAMPTSVEDFAAAIAADARRSDREPDAKIRDQLATEASRNAEACRRRAPQAAACLYYHAVALGLQARAQPTHAGELLNSMLVGLASAEAADPEYDQAGPARVRALVLVRAPGWPFGPGDADAGLVAARRAVTLRPQYPPNVLALAQALAKTGDTNGARESYERARDLAQALPPTTDRDDWLREANQALRRE